MGRHADGLQGREEEDGGRGGQLKHLRVLRLEAMRSAQTSADIHGSLLRLNFTFTLLNLADLAR